MLMTSAFSRAGRVALCQALAAAALGFAPSLAGVGESTAQAGADCYSIGQQVAADNGGTLAKASVTTRDNQTFCVIVVLVPGKQGQRPRRAEFVVAAQ